MALAYPHRQSVDDMRRQVEALRGYDPTEVADNLPKTLTIIGGAHDLLFPNDLLEKAADELGAEFHILDAGHSIHWDDPEGFASAVINAQ